MASLEVAVDLGEWKVLVASDRPSLFSEYRTHAALTEVFDEAAGPPDGYLFVAVTRPGEEWPSLVISETFSPSAGGFTPGTLVVPEAQSVFIGAGTRLLCYRAVAGGWVRHWQDEAEFGFWSWRQHGDVVLMSAELELAAWTIEGDPLWRTEVEPPWTYDLIAGVVRLDVMGTIKEFSLRRGPLED